MMNLRKQIKYKISAMAIFIFLFLGDLVKSAVLFLASPKAVITFFANKQMRDINYLRHTLPVLIDISKMKLLELVIRLLSGKKKRW
ncbi:MAG: hypothetical protein L3V56_06050 [Candidatus Magnetoovum sp. WYHC-5]|nr:hypothetical protein [Candidatus Magnetoovum sp. WYHC-5]